MGAARSVWAGWGWEEVRMGLGGGSDEGFRPEGQGPGASGDPSRARHGMYRFRS